MYGKIMHGTVKYGNKTRIYPLAPFVEYVIRLKARGLTRYRKYFNRIIK